MNSINSFSTTRSLKTNKTIMNKKMNRKNKESKINQKIPIFRNKKPNKNIIKNNSEKNLVFLRRIVLLVKEIF